MDLYFKKIKDHFEVSEKYRSRKGIVHTEDTQILKFIACHVSNEDIVVEVGGGSGAFLDLILENTDIKKAYNVELIFKAYRDQVNENITLIGGNILDLPFKNSSLNYLVAKNVLHHLVSKTRQKSKANARRAVEELIRVTKVGGYIIMLEEYNRYRLFSFLIFYLTLFFSRFSVGFEFFGLSKNVIISLLSPYEIKNLFSSSSNTDIVLNEVNRFNLSRKMKYTLLMSNTGRVLIIAKKLW